MVYANVVLAGGPGGVRARARPAAGASGLIVPDLPHDEAAELRAACDAEGLALVPLVAPTTHAGAAGGDRRGRARVRLHRLAHRAPPASAASCRPSCRHGRARARAPPTLPVAVGFGISTGRAGGRGGRPGRRRDRGQPGRARGRRGRRRRRSARARRRAGPGPPVGCPAMAETPTDQAARSPPRKKPAKPRRSARVKAVEKAAAVLLRGGRRPRPRRDGRHWHADGVERHGPARACSAAPEAVRALFAELFAAHARLRVHGHRDGRRPRGGRGAVADAAAPSTAAPFQGIEPTGRRIELRGTDCLEIDEDGKITRNTAYYDGAAFARQIGMLPAAGQRRRPGHAGRLQRRHQACRQGPAQGGRTLIVLVTFTVGLVFWVVAWAFGIKALRRLPVHRRSSPSTAAGVRIALPHVDAAAQGQPRPRRASADARPRAGRALCAAALLAAAARGRRLRRGRRGESTRAAGHAHRVRQRARPRDPAAAGRAVAGRRAAGAARRRRTRRRQARAAGRSSRRPAGRRATGIRARSRPTPSARPTTRRAIAYLGELDRGGVGGLAAAHQPGRPAPGVAAGRADQPDRRAARAPARRARALLPRRASGPSCGWCPPDLQVGRRDARAGPAAAAAPDRARGHRGLRRRASWPAVLDVPAAPRRRGPPWLASCSRTTPSASASARARPARDAAPARSCLRRAAGRRPRALLAELAARAAARAGGRVAARWPPTAGEGSRRPRRSPPCCPRPPSRARGARRAALRLRRRGAARGAVRLRRDGRWCSPRCARRRRPPRGGPGRAAPAPPQRGDRAATPCAATGDVAGRPVRWTVGTCVDRLGPTSARSARHRVRPQPIATTSLFRRGCARPC